MTENKKIIGDGLWVEALRNQRELISTEETMGKDMTEQFWTTIEQMVRDGG